MIDFASNLLSNIVYSLRVEDRNLANAILKQAIDSFVESVKRGADERILQMLMEVIKENRENSNWGWSTLHT